MLHKSRLNVECKKVESRLQTQMTNTKCRIDCAKYNVKLDIEFWRKWNAIRYGPLQVLSRYFSCSILHLVNVVELVKEKCWGQQGVCVV